jgi:hypothetical protein
MGFSFRAVFQRFGLTLKRQDQEQSRLKPALE